MPHTMLRRAWHESRIDMVGNVCAAWGSQGVLCGLDGS